jgi:HSP20 family protein
MRLVQWDPVQQLVAMRNRLHSTLDDSDIPRTEESIGTWGPLVDVFEKADRLVIRAELPGVQKEDMDIRIENGVLTLHGERKRDPDIKEENAYRMERVYGAFARSFSLPTTVDPTKVEATYKDGVLEVTIPKAETAKPKQIEIKAA